MMNQAEGVVVPGYKVASGTGGDPRFPGGTIRLQAPFIRDAIPDLEKFLEGPLYPGTINLSFAPCCVDLQDPEYHLCGIRWTKAFPAENFFLSRAGIGIGAFRYPVLLYFPDPATKPDHHHPPGIVELLARFLPEVRYGERATLYYPMDSILIRAA